MLIGALVGAMWFIHIIINVVNLFLGTPGNGRKCRTANPTCFIRIA